MTTNPYLARRLEQGQAAYDQGDWQTAILEFTRAIRSNPELLDAYYIRGCAYQRNKQYQEAAEDFTYILKREPRHASLYFERAYCYDVLGKHEEAIKDSTTALKIDSSTPEAYFLRGTAYYKLGQYDLALADLDHAIELSSSSVGLYLFRGKIYRQMKRLDDALDDFYVVIKNDPDDDEVYGERAQIYFDLHRDDESLDDARQAMRLNPQHPFPYHLIGMVFQRNGDRSQALEYYDQAAQRGDELAVEHAAKLRATILNQPSDQAVAPVVYAELALPSSEGTIVPTQIAQQQRAFITALISFSQQFDQVMHQIDHKLAEQKQAAQSELNSTQHGIKTFAGYIETLRQQTRKRLAELLPNEALATFEAQPNALPGVIVMLQDVEGELQAAKAQFAALEQTKKPDLAWMIMLFVPIAFIGNFAAGSSLMVLGSVVVFVCILVGIVTAGGSWANQMRSTVRALLQHLANAEHGTKQLAATALALHQQRSAEIDQRYAQQQSERKGAYGEQISEWFGKANAFSKKTAHISPAWGDPSWHTWVPAVMPAPILRLGSFDSGFDAFPLPVYVAFPGDRSLIFEVTGAQKAPAIEAMQALILRLLATIPPGQVHFTFIDPVGLGQNVAAFMRLADYNEALVKSKAWSEPRHIEQQLAKLTEHMENVIQKYLRNQYATIEAYNAQAGEIAEPYQVLVVFDFPVNFQDEAARRLLSIAQNGPRCGVFTIVLADLEKPRPYGFNLAELERVATVVSWHAARNHFVLPDPTYEYIDFELETLPKPALFNRILEQVGTVLLAAKKVEVPFARIASPLEAWWSPTATVVDRLSVPLGPSGARKLQDFTLGEGTSHHALVVGQIGSGKSTLLHSLIIGSALKYSPEELELYLLDFKKGVEFKTYAAYQLPHARVIAIESEREFGLSVLEGLYREYERRGDLFRGQHATNLKTYRAQTKQPLSRILLVVDEFHKFFIEQDKLANRAYQLLELLVREGRSTGIHVLLASQNLTGAANLPESIKGSFGVRIALQCSEADSRLIFADDNPAARLLSRPGEAIYNAQNGLIEGNNTFQVAWLPDAERDQYLQQIRALAERNGYQRPQIVFEGDEPADITKNILLKAALTAPAPDRHPRTLQAWLGEPVAITDPVAATFNRQSGTNILIVGTGEQAALGMITTTIISLATQLPRGQLQGAQTFSVLDFSADDGADHFRRLAEQLPSPVAVGRRRQMAGMINVIAQEVQRRFAADESGARPIFFILYGLHRARDLRQDAPGMGVGSNFSNSFGPSLEVHANEIEMSNSFGSTFGGANNAAQALPANPAQQLPLILHDGPEVGVHTIVWCDTLTNLNRTFDRSTLREFGLRVALQMSENDSQNLIEIGDANKLGPHCALLYNDEVGTLEKFRPYALPDPQWLKQFS